MNALSATPQPDPIRNANPAVWLAVIDDVLETTPEGPVRDLLIKDMQDRDQWGRSKYGVPLQPNNGRDALVDLYQEFLDATVYIKQYLLENPGNSLFEGLYVETRAMLTTVREQLYTLRGK